MMEELLPPEVLRLTQHLCEEKYEELVSRFEGLRRENSVLKSRLEKSEKDTHEFVSYFQKELESKDVRIHSLNERLALQQGENQKEIDAMVRSHASEVDTLRREAAAAESARTVRVKTLEEELERLESFSAEKRNMEEKIALLESELKDKSERLDEESRVNERKFLAEKSRLLKELEQRTTEIRRQAKRDVQNGLDVDTLKVIAENRRMTEELRFQQQMTREMQEEKNRVDRRLRLVKRDLELATDKDLEYAKIGQTRKRYIEKLEGRVEGLENAMREERTRHDERTNRLRQDLNAHLEEQTLDAAGLRQMLRLKNRELRKLRELANLVVGQRTEVEQFFIEALAEVKARIREQREAKHRDDIKMMRRKQLARAHGGQERDEYRTDSVTFPTIPSRQLDDEQPQYSMLAQATMGKAKIHLKDLSYEDREHVLRLLFAKINSVHRPPPPQEDEEECCRTFVTRKSF